MALSTVTIALPIILICSLIQFQAKASTCSCGPDFCIDSQGYKSSLASKKKRLIKDYPARNIALLDELDRCQASIERSPDSFSILRLKKDNSIVVDEWTAENEKIGATEFNSGAISVCRVIVTRRAFQCCGSQPFDQRADYDKLLDLNKTATLACEG